VSAAGSRESRKSLKTRLTDFFDIEHPILSAPMALISGGRLSAAVTSAGGLGLIGGGYGDSDWLHGMWKGEKFVERLTYDMTDPAIIGRSGFGVIDHVGRAVCRDGNGDPVEGWGLYEHGALGRHDPSGFKDWLTVAP